MLDVFSIFLSRGGSFEAPMTRQEAEATAETAYRFWTVSFVVKQRPFYAYIQ